MQTCTDDSLKWWNCQHRGQFAPKTLYVHFKSSFHLNEQYLYYFITHTHTHTLGGCITFSSPDTLLQKIVVFNFIVLCEGFQGRAAQKRESLSCALKESSELVLTGKYTVVTWQKQRNRLCDRMGTCSYGNKTSDKLLFI